ncbi:MAG TPA: methionyl-tRNA formyltransferase [Methylomirabilota bacterium]|nr:methionyl-tRNA formyltransferase [Methylomirabilota bacterium]
MSRLRIVFMGTAGLACASLRALAGQAGFELLSVVTQPDRPAGRELKLQPSPVKTTALDLGLPVMQPARARDPEFVQQLAALSPDLIVVVAYGQILPSVLLDLPAHGAVNVHTSLLPKYRGAAPIQFAILNDEPETGVTIMKMDAGLDTGPILTRRTTPILPEDDAITLQDRLAAMGAELLLETIPGYVSGTIMPQAQPAEGASYARKITRDDARLEWSQPARALWNRVRALVPWPGAGGTLATAAGRRPLKIWKAEVVSDISAQPGLVVRANAHEVVVACGKDALRLLELQREGGRRLAIKPFLAGTAIRPGDRFV